VGGGEAFALCVPGAGVPPPNGAKVHFELLGNARTSFGGRRWPDLSNTFATVTLKNGWAFGSNSGLRVMGKIRSGTIVFSNFAPVPSLLRGFAVWKLSKPASTLRLLTTRAGTSASLTVDGRRLAPRLVIPPARPTLDPALANLFRDDMRHLEAVANGDVTGACEFFGPNVLTGTVN